MPGIADTSGLHPREATRALTRKVLEVAGPILNDDATLLVLDWHGGHGRERRTTRAPNPRWRAGPVRSIHD